MQLDTDRAFLEAEALRLEQTQLALHRRQNLLQRRVQEVNGQRLANQARAAELALLKEDMGAREERLSQEREALQVKQEELKQGQEQLEKDRQQLAVDRSSLDEGCARYLDEQAKFRKELQTLADGRALLERQRYELSKELPDSTCRQPEGNAVSQTPP